jgi:isopentenyl diphosphate isomerase/L-lactate dehydrogenase-like FMN-dependent dehydrogenase
VTAEEREVVVGDVLSLREELDRSMALTGQTDAAAISRAALVASRACDAP